MLSKYNTIKFILDEAADKNHDINWSTWFNKVSRIFNHKIPEALLQGLSKLNIVELTELCDKHTYIAPINKQALQVERYYNWIKRRDEGNKRAAEQRKSIADAKRAEEMETRIKMQEYEFNKKLPIWEKQIKDLINKREKDNPWQTGFDL